jgi:uncharacterized protein (TIGR02466 family)
MAQFDYLFPTPVMISSFIPNNMKDIEELLISNSIDELKTRNWVTTQDNLHKIPPFQDFISKLKNEVKTYCNEMLLIDYNNLELTSLWANIHTENSAHDLHMHSNSFVSGVYYVRVPDKDQGHISFADPRDVREVFITDHTDPTDKRVTRIYDYKPQNGMLILFPSWLKHRVNQFKLDNDYRISMSFNFILTKSNLITRSFSYNK